MTKLLAHVWQAVGESRQLHHQQVCTDGYEVTEWANKNKTMPDGMSKRDDTITLEEHHSTDVHEASNT